MLLVTILMTNLPRRFEIKDRVALSMVEALKAVN